MKERLRANTALLIATVLFTGFAVAVLWDIRDLPPPLFGPVGAGDLPRVIGWIVIGLSLVVAGRALVRPAPASDTVATPQSRTAFLAVLAMTGAYAALLTWGAIDFGALSTAYLVATIGYLARPRGVGLIGLAAVAAGIGFGSDYVFTNLLFVDLP